MSESFLICTDLDGTLVPDGLAHESTLARSRFGQLVARSHIDVAYVTGRHRALVGQAIGEFALPRPQVVITDVGTSIYDVQVREWRAWASWRRVLAAQWERGASEHIRSVLRGVCGVERQEESKQSEFKLSYYLAAGSRTDEILEEVRSLLADCAVPSRIVVSHDGGGVGLLDVLPAAAGKLSAIQFLLHRLGYEGHRCLFAGDSGNDVDVLASRLPSVLVANATEGIRRRALATALEKGNARQLYLASGGFLGMNGNYAAGILEGIAHFRPDLVEGLV